MHSKRLTTTIIGGRYKHRSIRLPDLSTTRVSKNRLRASLFDTLQWVVPHSLFVEVFAGSGSMGIEALSRGAKEAYFIEQDSEAFTILANNLKGLQIENAHTILGDSFIQLPQLMRTITLNDEQPLILYFDPPFAIREGQTHIYDRLLTLISGVCATLRVGQAIVIIEHQSSVAMPSGIGEYQMYKKSRFGNTALSYFE